ncbi:hypothetical protein Hanom_Chr14g01289351 [Helianthus anomalus]
MLQNYVAFFDKTGTGIMGQVKLQGLTNGSVVHLHLSNGHIKLDSKEKPYSRTLVVHHFGSQGPLKVNLRLGTR